MANPLGQIPHPVKTPGQIRAQLQALVVVKPVVGRRSAKHATHERIVALSLIHI